MITRPMLAETLSKIDDLEYPIMVSLKLDGIRCVKVNGKALSRSFKPIPNHFIRNWIETNLPDGIDGEIMIEGKSFNQIQSLVMTENGEPDFTFYAFDYVKTSLNKPYESRYVDLLNLNINSDKFKIVKHTLINNSEELIEFENKAVNDGFEGVMIRSLSGQYKCGRSTKKQQWLLKLKRFEDSEAEIIGLEELEINTNKKETNELGLSKRSTKKEGKVKANTLGKFNVRDIYSGVEFEIGTGENLTWDTRKLIWDNRDSFIGKIVKYKYQPAGQKDKPRFPVWVGFRHIDDISK